MTHPADHATLPNFRRQRGAAALMTTLFLLIVVAMAVLVSLGMSGSDMSDSSSQHSSVSALFLAESGLERARQRFGSGTACTSLGIDGPHNLGQGSFTVNSGANTDFDGITALPVNQCRVQVTGRIATSNVSRTIEGVIQMGVKVQKGSFTKSPNTAVPVTQTVAGVGFQPRAVIFFWTRQPAVGFAANESMGFGFASGAANQRSVAIISDDAEGNSDFKRSRSVADVILMLEPNRGAGATIRARATLVTFNADGFQINWTANEARADIIHYIALGGDITNAFVGGFNANTAVGNQAVAGVGFRPDVVLLLNGATAAAVPASGVSNDKHINLGMMNNAGQQWAISACGRDGENNPAHSRGQQMVNNAIATITDSNANPCTVVNSRAAFVSMDAGGFTINWNIAPGGAVYPVFYLALGGGRHDLGSFNQATVVGNQQVAGVGFQPSGLFLTSFNRPAGAAILAQSEVSLGAASGTLARGTIWSESRDLGTTDANMATVTNRVIRLATGTSPPAAAAAATNAEADLASFDSAGFTLNWNPVDATARQILYWAVGSDAPVVRWRELP